MNSRPPNSLRGGPVRVLVVTGVSGAGKSTAVHALEDLGFFCVDNLPTPVLSSTVEALSAAGVRRIAFGIDVRVRGFLDDAAAAINGLSIPGEREIEVLFLDASDEAILRRFSSTRRPHPLSTTLQPGSEVSAVAVLDGIRIERELLTPLRARANAVLDTTRLSVNDLRRQILEHCAPGANSFPRTHVRFVSFGFKFGTPVDADVVLDVRFLQNPHFVPELRPLSGADEPVRAYVLDGEDTAGFVERARSLLEFCLPRFEREGKSYVTIAIGCTGGRHRSVVLTDHLAHLVEQALGLSIEVVHRDVDRVNMKGLGADPDHANPGTLFGFGGAR
ncbi:MAG TPA: RNase adapter RapZ [Polyangiaceae bacterium]|nr:RNase adapter RapZ [Polyangiaceae bacterium]